MTAGLAAAVALPRLALLPFNENLYGDAIPRTELGERWMAHPHLITAFGDGAGQYGPLHLYLIGLATTFADREIAGRLVSLLCGVLSVVPLYRLARRLAGWQAGVVACLAFAVWGIHIQFSTTAASEALALLLMLSAFDAFSASLANRRFSGMIRAAIWVNLASAVRYDVWMYPPLFVGAVLLMRPDTGLTRRQLVGFVASFAAMCLAFPLLWTLGNYRMHGDATYPLTYINQEHREWVSTFGGFWRELWLRSQGIGFWPAMALVSLSPGIAVFAAMGIVRAWRERPSVRWIMLVAVGPIAYYAVRISILHDFAPLTRFMTVFLALMLIWIWDGYLEAILRWGHERAHSFARFAVAAAIVVPTATGLFTFRRDGYLPDVIRPISPTSTNNRAILAGAGFARSVITPTDAKVVVDIDRAYLHLPLVFYGRLRPDQVIRIRSSEDVARVERERPDYVIRLDRGSLSRQQGVTTDGAALRIGTETYAQLNGFWPPVYVYRRAP